MGGKLLDLTGIRFNMLKVESILPRRVFGEKGKYYHKRMWLCVCDCGKKIEVNTGALTTGNTKSCGCLKNKSNAENSRKSRYLLAKKDGGYRSIFRMYNSNAKARNYEFNIDFDDFVKLLVMNCFYCGSEPNNLYMNIYYNFLYNGIDRRDNSKGYTLENSVSCCKMCNVAKNNNSESDFLNWVKKVNEFQNSKK